MRSSRALVLIGLGTVLAAGCDSSAPVAPTVASTAQQQVYLRGLVRDTLTRPVPAALVEIATGPLAGASRMSDGEGRFEFTGTAAAGSRVTLRVSKAGFETTSSDANWQVASEAQVFWTQIHPLDPPVGLGAGRYTLTIGFNVATAEGFPPIPTRPEIACVGFPVELASRTYDATIAERPRGQRLVSITGPTVDPLASDFSMTVAGDVATVNMESFIGEAFAGNSYLFIGGGEAPARFAVASNEVRVPFAADFRHCELFAARSSGECSQLPLERIVRQQWCRSHDVTLTFVKR